MGKINFRYIDSGPKTPKKNMAIDEELLESFDPEKAQPIFRLYQWRPAGISLGRFQKPEEIINIEACKKDNIPVVKRITGGGLIFHDDEITYSIICSDKHLSTKNINVKESYRILTSWIVKTYQKVGLRPHYTNGTGTRSKICFLQSEKYDISIHDKKIGGNAQRRKNGAILQHGSVPISLPTKQTLQKYLKIPINSIQKYTTSLSDEKIKIDIEDLKEIMKSSFKESVNAKF
ncbi:biotin/lipoate A/B protein ligase family protein [Candidatus Margulisiibacteriota bacterium]